MVDVRWPVAFLVVERIQIALEVVEQRVAVVDDTTQDAAARWRGVDRATRRVDDVNAGAVLDHEALGARERDPDDRSVGAEDHRWYEPALGASGALIDLVECGL